MRLALMVDTSAALDVAAALEAAAAERISVTTTQFAARLGGSFVIVTSAAHLARLARPEAAYDLQANLVE